VTSPADGHDLERFCADAYPRLVAAFTHQFGEQWLAEDVAQEALVRACDWSTVRGLESPHGWTFRVPQLHITFILRSLRA
jgi:DNA-directed RNA polymerase specialized sigma24 family protein